MVRKELIMKRLMDITNSIEVSGNALMVIGLGSTGAEIIRMDEYSDLDFFVIAKNGLKYKFLNDLCWLQNVHELGYTFRNTANGYKIMFEDGIYGEFAVFEEEELEKIPYSEARILWNDVSYENNTVLRSKIELPDIRKDSIEFAINEALSNLYIGLCRYARGEKLSGTRFIENLAVDQLISILHLIEEEVPYFPDKFQNDRRIEKRYPGFSQHLSEMQKGYSNAPTSAVYILNYLEAISPVNNKLASEIKNLAFQLTNI